MKHEFKPGNEFGQGRPPGSPNSVSSEAKKWLDSFFEGDEDKEQSVVDWKKLSAIQRWTIRAKFWSFQFPQLRAVDNTVTMDLTEEDFQKLKTAVFQDYWGARVGEKINLNDMP